MTSLSKTTKSLVLAAALALVTLVQPAARAEAMTITQGGPVMALSDVTSAPAQITLAPQGFEIHMAPVDAGAAVAVCASTHPRALRTIHLGAPLDDFSCFAAGGAMVPLSYRSNRSFDLRVTDGYQANHFSESHRTDTSSETVIKIGAVTYQDGLSGPFYLVVIVDRDGDRRLDAGEGHVARITSTTGPTPAANSSGRASTSAPAGSSDHRTSPPSASIVGVWSDAGKCLDYVYVFTPEGHYYEMSAQRPEGEWPRWSVVPGMYEIATFRRPPPFRFGFANNSDMHRSEMGITSITASGVRGYFVHGSMVDDEEELVPFRWTRCPVSDGPPF